MNLLQRLCIYGGLAVFAVVLLPANARAADDFTIRDFQSAIRIEESGEIDVTETIAVDFTAEKHGIFRDLPVTYEDTDGGRHGSRVTVETVLQDGQSAVVETEENGANLRIRIGDPDALITGTHIYELHYRVAGVLLGFPEYDELYWNVTGNEWDAPIEHVTSSVTLPQDGIIQVRCYAGFFGGTEACETNNQTRTQATFIANRRLEAGEGMTVAVGYTKGMVPLLTVAAPPNPLNRLFSYQSLTAGLLALVVSLWLVIRLWWTKGRDAWLVRRSLHDPNQKEGAVPLGVYETIVPEYNPPAGLRPAEMGVLVDERADTLDVSATIVDLAVRGYLTITEIPKKWWVRSQNYLLGRTNKSDKDLLSYEQTLLGNLFATGAVVELGSLKEKFYTHLAQVKDQLYDEVTRKQLFAGNPENVRSKYLLWAIGSLVVSGGAAWLGFVIIQPIVFGAGVGCSIASFVFLIISFTMPRRTAHGRELYRQVRGFRMFLDGTEKYRQQFFERENLFMTILPYAIVFGLTKKLATAMERMGIEPPQPTWYIGAHSFNPVVFASNIDTFSHSLSSAIASSPSSSGSGGGGFSGGGFGGGGGGSW